jgi:4-alpha-glucanotransferase
MQLEDALGVVEQANLPGTMAEHPNWRRKLTVALEQLAAEPDVRSLAEAIADSRREMALDATASIGDK